jgi:drug/metabolite transporter (DMT)-like permease
MNTYKTEMLVIGSVLMAAVGQTLIKLGLSGHGTLAMNVMARPIPITAGVFTGLLVYGLGTVMWFAAVRQRSISYLYPLAGINYVLMGFIGHFLLHESMGPLRWCGILVMTVGIMLLTKTDERRSEL